jgi:hypothetical protein
VADILRYPLRARLGRLKFSNQPNADERFPFRIQTEQKNRTTNKK